MRVVRRIVLLAIIGVLGTAGAAFAYQGQGNGGGWYNKADRGCPTQWSRYTLDPSNANYATLKLVDLNGDGVLCTKPSSTPGLSDFIDNISNH